MGTLTRVLAAAIVLLVIAGVVILATWDIPAPIQPVEKVVPDDRLAR